MTLTNGVFIFFGIIYRSDNVKIFIKIYILKYPIAKNKNLDLCSVECSIYFSGSVKRFKFKACVIFLRDTYVLYFERQKMTHNAEAGRFNDPSVYLKGMDNRYTPYSSVALTSAAPFSNTRIISLLAGSTSAVNPWRPRSLAMRINCLYRNVAMPIL